MKLGRYEVVRELGKGAMGIVYLAKDPLIGRLVALKTIRAAQHADDDEAKEFQQRFIREAQAAGILNHPAIVTVHDIGQDDASGMSFIAMEYVEGQNLKEVLNQGRTITFDQIGDIIAQVADALDFAHSKGIVHRDVKPANVILIDGNRAKITDFGIAKIASGGANLTTTGQFLGTPNYMAPEQIKGAPVDGRTDIFSLGICLYECLTRRKPFGGDSLTSISYKIVHEPFPPLHDINPQIPDGYEEVVASCLAKDPAKRYQRAKDLAAALRAVVRGEKPARPAEPALADETVVTRERTVAKTTISALPTVEVPFPEAAVAAQPETITPPPATRATVAVPVPAPAPAKAAPAPVRAEPLGQQMRRTLTAVRTMPLWRRRVSPGVFVGVIALLVALLVGGIAVFRARLNDFPRTDPAIVAKRATEKRLREEANALLRQGRVADARVKFEELHRLAPKSRFVAATLQKLDSIRQREELSKQQLADGQQRLDEAIALLAQKKYDAAIAKLRESAAINPTDTRIAEYLTVAQQQQQIEATARLARRSQPSTAPNESRAATGSLNAASAQTLTPAQLTTVFVHPFTDGRIVVRAGADIVANEQLFSERPARLFRRASRTPRSVSVTNELPAKNADVQVWVTVPAENIQEHHTLPRVRFDAGAQHRLIVHYDAAAKKFSYELN